jgi:hypothetical protein
VGSYLDGGLVSEWMHGLGWEEERERRTRVSIVSGRGGGLLMICLSERGFC